MNYLKIYLLSFFLLLNYLKAYASDNINDIKSLLEGKYELVYWTENKIRYLFIIAVILLLSQFYVAAIPFIVILHIILSTLNNLIP